MNFPQTFSVHHFPEKTVGKNARIPLFVFAALALLLVLSGCSPRSVQEANEESLKQRVVNCSIATIQRYEQHNEQDARPAGEYWIASPVPRYYLFNEELGVIAAKLYPLMKGDTLLALQYVPDDGAPGLDGNYPIVVTDNLACYESLINEEVSFAEIEVDSDLCWLVTNGGEIVPVENQEYDEDEGAPSHSEHETTEEELVPFLASIDYSTPGKWIDINLNR
ncbi:hypothetical protein VJ918_00865 [Adlercreutzia sp. R21]|uniref:DUF4825 domain-containing protein n=1 Tax=Adlercreutzia wanghongyangiae TaxID=3111451 RepID=A0ABU6IGC5_9ACTN|nr:hypothetical protein [Adlercreutzia sp. R21]MEC4175499.1 hypothetical protein [Adlercreutzia sp. R7]MEC4183353.1 hypothetical protein [Adlercreutzia sp. R21]